MKVVDVGRVKIGKIRIEILRFFEELGHFGALASVPIGDVFGEVLRLTKAIGKVGYPRNIPLGNVRVEIDCTSKRIGHGCDLVQQVEETRNNEA